MDYIRQILMEGEEIKIGSFGKFTVVTDLEVNKIAMLCASKSLNQVLTAGDSLSDEKEINRQIAGCNVTITFNGYNPDIKKKILDMLCDSFEKRVMEGSEETTDDQTIKSA